MATTSAERSAERGTENTTSWMRLARGAAVTMVIWSVVLQLIARSVIPPVTVIGLVFLAFVPFLNGDRRKLGMGLSIFTAAALLGNLPGILDELQNPDSAPAFILTLLSVVAAVVALVAGLGAFFRWSPRPIQTLALGGAAVFAAGTVGSLVIAANAPSDGALASDVEVTARQVAWDPGEITLDTDAGGVWIQNDDGIRHTFTVEELGVDLEIPGLKSRRVDIDAVPGTYQIICTVPGHEAMTGTLNVIG